MKVLIKYLLLAFIYLVVFTGATYESKNVHVRVDNQKETYKVGDTVSMTVFVKTDLLSVNSDEMKQNGIEIIKKTAWHRSQADGVIECDMCVVIKISEHCFLFLDSFNDKQFKINQYILSFEKI